MNTCIISMAAWFRLPRVCIFYLFFLWNTSQLLIETALLKSWLMGLMYFWKGLGLLFGLCSFFASQGYCDWKVLKGDRGSLTDRSRVPKTGHVDARQTQMELSGATLFQSYSSIKSLFLSAQNKHVTGLHSTKESPPKKKKSLWMILQSQLESVECNRNIKLHWYVTFGLWSYTKKKQKNNWCRNYFYTEHCKFHK